MKISRALLFILSISIALTAITAAGSSAVASGYTAKDITLQPGNNESSMNFCWYSTVNSRCYVQIAKAYEMNGTEFPADTQSFSGSVSTASTGYYSNKVIVTGLEPQTEYAYRVGNGASYSGVYSF